MELNSTEDRLSKWEIVDKELNRAKKIHSEYPQNMYVQLAILQEEVGEVTKAVLDFHDNKDSLVHIQEELVQTAAMCMRMIEALPFPIENTYYVGRWITPNKVEIEVIS